MPPANVALDAIERRLCLGIGVAPGGRLPLQFLKLVFGMVDGARGGKRIFGILTRRLGLFPCISRALASLFQALKLVCLLHLRALGLRERRPLLGQGSLRGARGIAKALFGRLRLGGGGLRGLALGIGAVDRFPQIIKLSFEAGQPVALRKTAGRGARRMGGRYKSIPAPEIAFFRDKPLSLAQALLQPVPILSGGDNPDLREPARQLDRSAHRGRKRLRLLRKGRIASHDADQAPSGWRVLIGGHVEIVAQRRAQRDFKAGRNEDLVDDGLEPPGVRRLQKLDKGRHLGFEGLRLEASGLSGIARVLLAGPRMGDRFLRRDDVPFQRFELVFEHRHLFAKRIDRRGRGSPGAKLGELPPDLGLLSAETARARAVLRNLRFELAALRAKLGDLGRKSGNRRLRLIQRVKRDIGPLRYLRLRLGPVALRLDGLFLAVEPGKKLARLGDRGVFAFGVLLNLLVSRFQLGFPLLGAGLFAVERVAFNLNAVQDRRARGLLIAKRLQGVRRLCLATQRGRLGLGELARRRARLREAALPRFARPRSPPHNADGAGPLRACEAPPSIPCISAPGAPAAVNSRAASRSAPSRP